MADKKTTPEIATCPARHFAGISARYSHASKSGIPDQWRRFNSGAPLAGAVPGAAYGIVHNFIEPDQWDYVCACEVGASQEALPDGHARLTVPGGTFAIFHFDEPIMRIDAAMGAVFGWIGASDYRPDGGVTLERYGPGFDPATGTGGYDIMVRVARRA